MAKEVFSATLKAPGFYGINSQESATDLATGFALEATNCIIDSRGRVGSRRGWTPFTTALPAVDGAIGSIDEFVDGSDNPLVFFAANNKLFKIVSGSPVELTYGGGGTAPSITGNNWQQASVGNRHYFFQKGHAPLVYDPSVSTTTYKRVTETSGYTATVPEANCVFSAYGRLWAGNTANDSDTLCFSDLLNGNVWSTGTAGTLDLSTVWQGGSDAIQGIAGFNGFLFIFGTRQILVYKGAEDPSTMSLQDIIVGIGCVGRDTIQVTGSDIIFLSKVGVMSLMRLIQEKSAPMRDLSMNVRDDLVANTAGEDPDMIKSAYYPRDAFYLVTLPATGYTYCFDMRASPLQNGASRVTIWNNITPTAYCVTASNQLLLGKVDYVGLYDGYTDNGETYRMVYKTNYFDLDQPTKVKILKKLGWVLIGGAGQPVSVKWGFDYEENMYGTSIVLGGEAVSEYNIAEYGIGEYSDGVVIDDVYCMAGGHGEAVQLGMEVDINGTFLSIQRVDVYLKLGKVSY